MILSEPSSNQLWRLADASLNRMVEGFHYREDFCRFVLDNRRLNQQLKNIRHEMLVSGWANHKMLIEARDVAEYVGTNLEDEAEKENLRGLLSSVVANCRRVQEALRSLEETSKIIDLASNLTYKNTTVPL